MPRQIVIVGGGAAGFAAAEMLRRQDYRGSIVMLSNEATAPVDRPNLSKDYLAGSAPEDWLPLRPDDFYTEAKIDLRLNTEVTSIDTNARHVVTSGGETIPYDRLLLATGAEPVRLPIPGADQPHVHVLRSLADSRAIIALADGARRAVVIGASFIGLEAAASLRARNIEVHVVGLEQRPMERVLGPEMGDFVRALHEEHGVIFHLGDTVTAIDGKRATLKSGGAIEADIVVVGVGVRPRLGLAEKAGLAIDRGVTVNMPIWKPASPASMPRAISRAGPIRIPARTSASSIGWWPSVRARPRRETCSGSASASMPCRSSGASITMCRSTMSVTPRNGTKSPSTATSPAGIACCSTRAGPRARRRLDLSRRRKPRGGACDGDGAIVLGQASRSRIKCLSTSCPGLSRASTSLNSLKQARTWMAGTSPAMTKKTETTRRHAHRSRNLRRALPQFPLGHSRRASTWRPRAATAMRTAPAVWR